MAIVSQTNIGTVPKATLGKRLKDGICLMYFLCVCVCVCVRACVRACMHARARVFVCVCVAVVIIFLFFFSLLFCFLQFLSTRN